MQDAGPHKSLSIAAAANVATAAFILAIKPIILVSVGIVACVAVTLFK